MTPNLTPFQRIERARKVMLWRDQVNCTWKWIGKMLGVPAGAASMIYRYGCRLRDVLGRLPQNEDDLKEMIEGRYTVSGWYRPGNYGVSVSVLKELSTAAGLKSFEVKGKFYVKQSGG